jgi:uncharacterized membrane protein
MKAVYLHLRRHIIRGTLASIPLVLSFLLVRFLYLAIDQRVASLIQRVLGVRIPGLGLVLVLILLYLAGLAVSHWVGRQVFRLIEAFTVRLPLVKTVYQLGKNLAEALSLPEKRAFQQAVLVEYFRPGVWTIGFVTGAIIDRHSGERLLKLFIPTTPNPTSGFMALIPEIQARPLSWSVEEAINAVISGGLIGPETI